MRSSWKIGIVVVALILLAVFAGKFVFRGDDKGAFVDRLGVRQNQVRRFSDGVFVASGEENIYPVSVMIENLVTVRPQKGLQSANIVYEALAEGGITRMMAVYASGKDIKEIGPVRSSRPYYVDRAQEYRGAYAHIGGSPGAQASIENYNVLDLDALAGDHAYFWRSKDVPPPHNLFTSSELLARALRDNNAKEVGDFDPWKFKEDRLINERGNPQSPIHIDFSSQSYAVDYRYEQDGNVYSRTNGGQPHHDGLNGKQILVKNVVVQFVESNVADAAGRLMVQTSGSGRAILFQDGLAIEGTWEKKDDHESRTRFYDAEKKQMEFNAGPIWIEVVPNAKTVTY